MIINRNNSVWKYLRERKIEVAGYLNVKGHCIFEPPCLVGTTLEGHFLNGIILKAFSYISITSKIFCVPIVVGRYCSIAPNLSSRRSHPIHELITTSPAIYDNSDCPQSFNEIENYSYKDFLTRSFDLEYIQASNKSFKKLRKNTVTIGNDVYIGQDVFIKPGVKIGDGAVVGACSVVTKDIPPYAVVAGVPAKIIKYRYSQKHIDLLLESKWWDYAPWQLKGATIDDVEEFVEFIKNLRKNKVKPYKPKLIELEFE